MSDLILKDKSNPTPNTYYALVHIAQLKKLPSKH